MKILANYELTGINSSVKKNNNNQTKNLSSVKAHNTAYDFWKFNYLLIIIN